MTHQVAKAPQQHPTHRHESVLRVLALVFLSLRSLNYWPAEIAEIAERSEPLVRAAPAIAWDKNFCNFRYFCGT